MAQISKLSNAYLLSFEVYQRLCYLTPLWIFLFRLLLATILP